jgi:peptidoglycan LD-endopeptidase CwlK
MQTPEVFKNDPLFFQRLMKSVGYYPFELDGDWGTKTQEAADKFVKESERIATKYTSFDARTEACILTMMPKAQEAARRFMVAAKPFKYQVKILSGTRTYAEQAAIYAQGRSKPGKIVTKAGPGQSNHNFGIAFDVGIFDGKTYFTGATSAQEKAYVDLRSLTKKAVPELDWGGDWKSIKDKPHYELRTGKSTSQVRAALEKGVAYV